MNDVPPEPLSLTPLPEPPELTGDAALERIVDAVTELTSLLEQRPSPPQRALQEAFSLEQLQRHLDYYRREHLRDQAAMFAEDSDFPGRAELVAAWELMAADIKRRIHVATMAAEDHRRLAVRYKELTQYLLQVIPVGLNLNPKPIHTVVQLYTTKMIFAAEPGDEINHKRAPLSPQGAALEQDLQRLIEFLRGCKAEALSRLSQFDVPLAKVKPELDERMCKAAEFILRSNSKGINPSGADLAKFLGLSVGTVRNSYIPTLRKYGLENEHGYLFRPGSKIREILASHDVA